MNGRVFVVVMQLCSYCPICFNNHLAIEEIIRIHHECEGRIEKSAPRMTVWHHEACRVMTNSDPEGQIFLTYCKSLDFNHDSVDILSIFLFACMYLSVCLSVYLPVSVCLYVCLPVSVCLSVYLRVYTCLCLSVYMPVCLLVYQSVCVRLPVSVCLSVYLPVCQSVCVCLSVSVCLSVCLYKWYN